MDKCAICGGAVELIRHRQVFKIAEKPIPCVVEDILAERCRDCGEVFIGKEGNSYIDRQLNIFKNDGLDIYVNEVIESKGITREAIGMLLGYDQKQAKQALYQKLKVIGSGKLIFFCQIAKILNVKLNDLVRYYPIEERQGELYLNRDSEII